MTTTTKKPTVPVININGTHPDTLLDGLAATRDAIRKAIEAIGQCAPNARDYQTAPDLWPVARDEHIARFEALHRIKQELVDIAEGIIDQTR